MLPIDDAPKQGRAPGALFAELISLTELMT